MKFNKVHKIFFGLNTQTTCFSGNLTDTCSWLSGKFLYLCLVVVEGVFYAKNIFLFYRSLITTNIHCDAVIGYPNDKDLSIKNILLNSRIVKNKIIIFIGLIFCLMIPKVALFAQLQSIGSWKSYQTHRQARDICARGNYIFAATDVGIVQLNSLDTNDYQRFTKQDGFLGDIPSVIFYDEVHDYVFVGYENGLIHYFKDPKQRIFSIRDIYLTKNFNTKKINAIIVSGDYLYIGTSFGVVVYDFPKNETRYTYLKMGANDEAQEVASLAIFQGRLWVSVSGGQALGVYSASLAMPNLADASVWQRENGTYGLASSGTPKKLATFNNRIFCHLGDSLYARLDTTWEVINNQYLTTGSYKFMRPSGKNLYLITGTQIIQYSPSGIIKTYSSQIPIAAIELNGVVWVADFVLGVVGYEEISQGLYYTAHEPLTNSFCNRIGVANGELYIAPLGHNANFKPSYDYSGYYYYNIRNNQWKMVRTDQLDPDAEKIFHSYARISTRPGTKETWMGSFGGGISIVTDGSQWKKTLSSADGLPVTANNPKDIRIAGIEFDGYGNTWIATYYTPTPLTVISSTDQLYNFAFPAFDNPLFTQLTLDSYGTCWLINRDKGIVVFNDNKTPNNTADDKVRELRTSTGKGNLPSDNVNRITRDLDGNMWIATNKGAVVFYNPSEIFKENATISDASCPILSSRCLLREENVKVIAIDGANRKWIGTQNGIFVISPDGNEQIALFDIDNSPLPSNEILDLAIDQETGEIFIATSAGIVSYRGEASLSTGNSENIFVFPNPVKADFDGLIAIRGTAPNAIVKITSVTGLLVAQLTALGGQAVWNGKDQRGQKVAPGIYLALVSLPSGEQAGIAKFVILN